METPDAEAEWEEEMPTASECTPKRGQSRARKLEMLRAQGTGQQPQHHRKGRSEGRGKEQGGGAEKWRVTRSLGASLSLCSSICTAALVPLHPQEPPPTPHPTICKRHQLPSHSCCPRPSSEETTLIRRFPALTVPDR